MHDHGNQQNIFDRLDLKPSSKDTINLNLGFTRSWFQTPNSFDSQNATAWSGPGWCDNERAWARTARPVGSTDQVSKISTFNIAPIWTRVIEREYGVHVRRVRAAGSIQLLSERRSVRGSHSGSSNQHHRPESPADQPGLRAEPIDGEGHSQHQGGRHVGGHDSDGGRQLRNCRSDVQRGVPECRREPEHEPAAHQSRRIAAARCKPIPASIRCWPATT